MDNKELVPGTTLYLPVQVDDALFQSVMATRCRAMGRYARRR